MTTAECTTVKEWRCVKWPPTPADLRRLEELIATRTKAAEDKCVELGLPEFCRTWVREYHGTTVRGTHLWTSAIRTGGGAEDIDLFDRYSTRNQVWRYVAQWSHGYRMVLICPQHRLTLTYCEGDVSLVWCPTRQHFFAELQDAHRFYARYS